MTPNTGYWVFIDEVLTIIDQETYNTGVFIDYLLAKISIFLVKRLAFIYVIPYNINIRLRSEVTVNKNVELYKMI